MKDGATPKASYITDRFGNASGGVRSPYLDVPIATYHPNSTGQTTCRNLGRKVPFDCARLEALCGSSKSYATKVAQSSIDWSRNTG